MAGHAGEHQPKVTQVRAAALLDKDTAGGLSTSGGVDMAGWDRVAFDINIGTAVSGAVFDAWLMESNESNLGNAVNLMKQKNSSAQIAITQASGEADTAIVAIAGNTHVQGVPCSGRWAPPGALQMVVRGALRGSCRLRPDAVEPNW